MNSAVRRLPKAQMEKVRQAEAARLAQAARQNAMAKVRGQELALCGGRKAFPDDRWRSDR